VIAADTSAWLDYSKGADSEGSTRLEAALAAGTLVLPMPVLFELLSGPGLTSEARALILELPRLEISPGFWERAGDLRRDLLLSGRKARSMDCLIAQNCMDHKIALIASGCDFRNFSAQGLVLPE
jgi:predicted nucleic acid-binding protein